MFRHPLQRIVFAPDGDPPSAPPAGDPPPTPTPPPAPAAADWRASLPDEFRSHPVISNFETPAELAKSWIEAQKLIGADKIVVPGKDARPEDVAAVFERLGKPKDVAGYEVPPIEGHEYSEQDKAFQATFKGWAHKRNLTGEQFKGLAADWNALQQAQEVARNKALQTAREGLKAEWGEEHDARMDMASSAIRDFAKDAGVDTKALETMRLADGSFLFDNPTIARLFAAVGASTTGSGFEGGQAGDRGRDDFASPKAAKAAIERIRGEIHAAKGAHPYSDRQHPQHKQWASRMSKLHEIAGKANE